VSIQGVSRDHVTVQYRPRNILSMMVTVCMSHKRKADSWQVNILKIGFLPIYKRFSSYLTGNTLLHPYRDKPVNSVAVYCENRVEHSI
jgi:hypothetical protein